MAMNGNLVLRVAGLLTAALLTSGCVPVRTVDAGEFIRLYSQPRTVAKHYDYMGRRGSYCYLDYYSAEDGASIVHLQYTVRSKASELPSGFPRRGQAPIEDIEPGDLSWWTDGPPRPGPREEREASKQ